MPKAARAPVTLAVINAAEDAKGILEGLRDELQEWYDNLPENFQNGDKGQALEEAIGNLDSAIDSINDAPEEAVDVQTFTAPPMCTKRRPSRADRRDDACALLSAVVDEVGMYCNKLKEKHDEKDEEKISTLEEWVSELESAKDEAEAVEFPGMYG